MKRLYRGGEVSPLLHDIDAIAWRAMGWTDSPEPPAAPPKPIPLPAAPAPTEIPPALALINGTDISRDMAIIPTVGQAAANALIKNRPDGGYPSLEAVWEANPDLLAGRFKVDPDTIAAWGG